MASYIQEDSSSVGEVSDDPSSETLGSNKASYGIIVCLLCAVSALEGADQQLLASCLKALQSDLGLKLNALGNLNLVQALLQALSAPVWGIIADRDILTRRAILTIGCVGWGLCTMGLAMATEMWQMIIFRAVNGTMLACLRPISNGLVADVTEEEKRGRVYGQVQLSLDLGLMVTNLVATPLSRKTVHGVPGWRLAFGSIGVFSLLMAAIIQLCMKEPKRDRVGSGKGADGLLGEELGRLGQLLRMPTFLVIILQGVFGIIPWNAMGFMTLYFQTAGITDFKAAVLTTAMPLAAGFGHFAGGMIGDCFARRSPYHGRALTAQISVVLSIPVLYCIFVAVPPHPGYFGQFLTLEILFGLTATWCAAGVNWPIMSEIVPPASRSAIIAWDTAIEGASGAFMGNFVVTHLAHDVFGYDIEREQAKAEGAGKSFKASPENAHALGQALVWTTIAPFLVCLVFYSLLHWAYPRDLERVRMLAAEENERHEMSEGNSDESE
uniref:Major facilitator superfamily (MFS) profile domain-containing protein n=1 Tax=Alexandrium monilatum TaxID=311494 RepID=A0A7S4WGD1_9DINO